MIRRSLDALVRYLRSSPWISSVDSLDDIDAELEFHLAERTEAFIAQGMNGHEARQAALAKFGDRAEIARALHREGVAGMAWMHRVHLAVTMGLSACVLFLLTAWWTENRVNNETHRSLPPAVASLMNEDWTGGVCGVVTRDDGRPIAGASVLMSVKTWPGGSFFQRAYTTKTDASGRYRVENVCPVNDTYEVQIAVVADNHQMQSKYLEMDGGDLDDVSFALSRSDVMHLRVVDATGTPLSGVRILPQGRVDESGKRHVVYFDSGQTIIQETDVDGQASFAFFQPGDQATFLVEIEEGTWVPFDVRVPSVGETAAIQCPS